MPSVFSKDCSEYKRTLKNLEYAALYFSNNKTEQLCYNKYGTKDGQGLLPVSDYFIDTFILRYTCKENVSQEQDKLQLSKVQSLIRKIFGGQTQTHFTAMSESYIDVRINLPDHSLDSVLTFLNSNELKDTEFVLWTIDITRDFSGSFELYEIIDYFQSFHNLHTGFHADAIYMEKDMEEGSGTNCFIFKNMTKSIRSKMYLKFPQLLQSNKVQETVGQRWAAWADTDESHRLVGTRDKSVERGLTRIEITYYARGLFIPDKVFLCRQIDEMVSMMPPSIFYATSHANMWSVYSESLKHSLIIADERFGKVNKNDGGLALIVYSIDNSCGKISGFVVKNWNKAKDRLLSRVTFSYMLPVDYIKLEVGHMDEDGIALNCEKSIFQKRIKQGFQDWTYLLNKRGIAINQNITQKDMSGFGFIETINCTPMISNKAVQITSKQPCTLHLQETCALVVLTRRHTTKVSMDECTSISDRSGISTASCVTPIESLSPQNLEVPSLEEIKMLSIVSLKKLKRGTYLVMALLFSEKEYPKMIIIVEGKTKVVYCSQLIKDSIPTNINLDTNGMLTSETVLGKLTVNYHRKNPKSSKVKLELNV